MAVCVQYNKHSTQLGLPLAPVIDKFNGKDVYAPFPCKPGLRHSVNREGHENVDFASGYKEFDDRQKQFAARR